MRRVKSENIEPGMTLARPILDEHGNILLREGVDLTESHINSIRKKGFPAIFVQESGELPEIPLDDDLDPDVRANAMQVLDKAFQEIDKIADDVKDETFENVQRAMDSKAIKALISSDGPLGKIDAVVEEILEDILDLELLAGLTSIKNADTHMLSHSIDVCVIAIMIGKAAGMDRQRLGQMAKGALLHDIGKLFVDSKADEVTRVRQHTLLGYELLRQGMDMIVPHVALEHHEHQNGTGQPRGVRGTNTIRREHRPDNPVLSLAGEIVAIANAYDNLVSGTAKTPPLTPESALQTITELQTTQFNKEIVTAFRRVVPVYPLGTQVLIRSGQYKNYRGLVAKVNEDAPDRPALLLYKDNHGNSITTIEFNTHSHPNAELRSVGLE